MSYADAISRVGQIQAQLAALRAGPAAGAAAPAATSPASASTPTSQTYAPYAPAGSSFAATLASAQSAQPVQPPGALGSSDSLSGALAAPGVAGAGLPAGATRLLTGAQQEFAARLAANTGLSPQVISAWLLAEESGGAASARQSAGNNDWLNIGYTDSGTFGAADSVWSNPITAADATAGWLKGQNTIPGYGTASPGIQAILATAGQPPAAQVAAIQSSGWASSGYPDLPGLVAQLGA